MEEINKSVRSKSTSKGEITQLMTALSANTIRDIVNLSNELNIKREDIVSLLKENGQFILVYYK